MTRRWFGCGVALGLVGLAGCARPVAPTGGEVPQTPLRVAESWPEPLSVVEPFSGPVVLEFQRGVSERLTDGTPRNAVVVSPRTGEIDVRLRAQGLEISMDGGFTEPTVYRITILPRFQDRYQNRMFEAFDLVFSTGPELEPNLLAGVVEDRLTLRPLAGVRVDAIPVEQDLAHSAVSDSTGIFTFPYLPAGRYRVLAYEDLNRNREPDFTERQDSVEVGLSRGDTLIVTDLALLAPDTTAAVLETVMSVDSLTIRVTFDDYLDPADPLDQVEARLLREDGNAPEVLEVLHRHEWEARQMDADPDPPDPGVPPPAPPTVLPSRDLVLPLSRPLLAGVVYQVELGGVRNINEVPGGGGSIVIEGPPEPTPPPADPGDPPADPGDPPADPGDPPADLPNAPPTDPPAGAQPG